MVGLPFPWILNSLIRSTRGETYTGNPVLAESMAFNILMLVGMLVVVVVDFLMKPGMLLLWWFASSYGGVFVIVAN